MNEQELSERTVALEQRCKSNSHRIDTLEQTAAAIQEMALAVRELAIEMKNMKSEQQDVISRLSAIEKKPSERLEMIIKTALTSIVSAALGALLGQFF